MNATPLGRSAVAAGRPGHEWPADADCISGRDHVAVYLDPLAGSPAIKECLRAETQVLAVGRRGFLKEDGTGDPRRGQQPFRLLVRDGKGRERADEADVVLDCTGTYSQHRWLGDGGIPAAGELAGEPHITYAVDDVLGDHRAGYAGKTVLVAGSGYSAATTVCNLAALADREPSTWVIWLARGAGTQPLRRFPNDPLRERDRLAVRANALATRGDGNVEFHAQTTIDWISFVAPDKGFKVGARIAGKPKEWEVDRVIANLGYTPDTALYRELQVHECYATLGPMKLAAALANVTGGDCLTVPSQGPEALRNPEPGFFVLGAKSYGRNSHFLLRTGFEQVRDVFRLITGKGALDLYKPAM
jgi:hypothetical protein